MAKEVAKSTDFKWNYSTTSVLVKIFFLQRCSYQYFVSSMLSIRSSAKNAFSYINKSILVHITYDSIKSHLLFMEWMQVVWYLIFITSRHICTHNQFHINVNSITWVINNINYSRIIPIFQLSTTSNQSYWKSRFDRPEMVGKSNGPNHLVSFNLFGVVLVGYCCTSVFLFVIGML